MTSAASPSADTRAEAEALARPRYLPGVCRERPSVRRQLRVARRSGRLAGGSPDAFLLLDPPAGTPPTAGGVATAVETHWPLAVVTAWTAALFGAAVLTTVLFPAWPPRVAVALALVAAGLGLTAMVLSATVVRQAAALVRSLSERRHLDRIIGDHWHARLLHVEDPAALPGLIDEARRITGGAVLLLDPRRVTTEAARTAVAGLPDARRLPGTTVRVIGVRPRLTEPGSRRVSMVPGFLLLTAAVAIGLAVSAVLVAGAESAACGRACTDRPADVVSALYWLLSHLLPFEPDGLEAQTWSARWIGVPWSVFNILVLVTGIGLFVQHAVEASRSAGVDLAARFNTERRAEEEAAVPAAVPAAVAPAVAAPAIASAPRGGTVAGLFAAGVALGVAAAAVALRRRRG